VLHGTPVCCLDGSVILSARRSSARWQAGQPQLTQHRVRPAPGGTSAPPWPPPPAHDAGCTRLSLGPPLLRVPTGALPWSSARGVPSPLCHAGIVSAHTFHYARVLVCHRCRRSYLTTSSIDILSQLRLTYSLKCTVATLLLPRATVHASYLRSIAYGRSSCIILLLL